MAGIATVTLNAALDRTLHVDRIEPGHKSRLLGESVQAGGKGVNAARVLRALGCETRALVVVGGATGSAIADDLAASGLPSDCIEAPGSSRTCLEIVEPDGRATQLHGAGVDGRSLEAPVRRAVEALPRDFGWIAFSGSLPPGMPVQTLAALVRVARGHGLRVAVDAAGEALRAAWAAGPDLVRINQDELADALRVAGDAPREPREPSPFASLGRAAQGVVSRGAEPFEAWAGSARYRVTPPAVEVVNAIGCGDAMLAGLLARLDAGDAFDRALRFATALAAADAASPLAGRTDLELARSLEPRVEIDSPAGG